MLLDLNEHWCLSGGADGADLQWGMVAGSIGHRVVHFSFEGERTSAPETEVVRLTTAQLLTADAHCRKANRTLQRRFPTKSARTNNLLRRNWYQVQPSHACYAISTFDLVPGPTIPLGTVLRDLRVKGGTAWAVQMFIDKHGGAACPCYLFDQVLCHWFQWIGDGWQRIYQPPKPSGIYAGIGRRDLLAMGRLAIRVLMEYTKKANTRITLEQAEQAAKRLFEERARLLEGHKMGAWESLPDLMKQALIHVELTRLD
jgi:hypothetical protein